MTLNLIGAFGIGPCELVAFTGGGGKTTLLLGLGRQLAGRGDRVLLTTTTKLGLNQTGASRVCWSIDRVEIEAALDRGEPVFVLSESDDHRVRGYDPEVVGDLFKHGSARYVLVEADGSRGLPAKAPADHEPVVPAAATVVVVVMGVDAIGRTIAEAFHRPALAARLSGRVESDVITPEIAAAVLTHPAGGFKGIPAAARLILAITKVGPASEEEADAVGKLVGANSRVERVVAVPFDEGLIRRA